MLIGSSAECGSKQYKDEGGDFTKSKVGNSAYYSFCFVVLCLWYNVNELYNRRGVYRISPTFSA